MRMIYKLFMALFLTCKLGILHHINLAWRNKTYITQLKDPLSIQFQSSLTISSQNLKISKIY